MMVFLCSSILITTKMVEGNGLNFELKGQHPNHREYLIGYRDMIPRSWLVYQVYLGPLLLIWINFNSSMDK